MPVDVIAPVHDSATVCSTAMDVLSVPVVGTVAPAVSEHVAMAPVDAMPPPSVLPVIRHSSRVRSAYDHHAMPPLHSAVNLQACVEISPGRAGRRRNRRYRARSRRSGKAGGVSPSTLVADVLSVSELALLQP